jgi:predicted 3-demethylubiquinone-9 3-methyltransferase (glyoxalase superfamily)
MQKIVPFLWFDTEAEQAANFYVSVFKNSKIGKIVRYGEAGPGPKDRVLTVAFELDGVEFTALNGGPHFKFTEAISLHVPCESQAEVDYFWDKLSAGGQASKCGWLKDKFGLSWQISPAALDEMMKNGTREQVDRVTQAFLPMKKFDIAELQKAYEGQ